MKRWQWLVRGVPAGMLAVVSWGLAVPAEAGIEHWVRQCQKENSADWCVQRGRQLALTSPGDASAAFNIESGFARAFAAEFGTQSPGIRMRTGGGIPRGALDLSAADRERVRSPDGLRQYLGERAGKGDARIDFLYAGASKDADRVQRMQRAAAAGHADAMYVLGFMYANGVDDLRRDDAQAGQWLARAAKAGNGAAMGRHARQLAARGGTAAADALKLAAEGCERGAQYACITQADLLLADVDRGEMSPEDRTQAVTRAMQFYTGALIRDSRGFSLEPERQAALYALARIYVEGRHVPANKLEARDDLVRALNVDGAMLTEAWMAWADAVIAGPDGPYEFQRETKRGLEALRRFADMGDPGATLALGIALIGGQEGVTPDTLQARALLKRAAAAGDTVAMTTLARHYASDGNDPEAFRWVQQAVAIGDPYGIYLASQHYRKGLGTDKNEAAFHASLEQSCALNYMRACIDQGNAQVMGSDGYPQNIDAGLALLEKARAAGSAQASYLIGATRLRTAGYDNPDRLEAAILILLEASKRGSKEADETITRIEKGDNAVVRQALSRARGDAVPQQLSIQEAAERAAAAGGVAVAPVLPEKTATGKKAAPAKPAAKPAANGSKPVR